MDTGVKKTNRVTLKDSLKHQYEFFIYSFSLLAIVALTIFAFLNITTYDHFLGILELTIAIILSVNLILLWITRNAKLCAFVLLSGVYVLLLILFITGGIANTGIYWFFTFPPAVFFLSGRKKAVFWLLFLYTSIGLLIIAADKQYLTLPYTLIQIRQLVAAHIVVSVSLYIYENTREAFEKELESSKKEAGKEDGIDA